MREEMIKKMYDELNRVKWFLSDYEREAVNAILDEFVKANGGRCP